MVKTLVSTSCSIFLPFLWKDMGYSKFFIGCALFVFTFVGGIASALSPIVEKKFGTKNVLYFSIIMTCPLLLGFVLTYEIMPWVAFLMFVLTGAITMMASPVIMVVAQNLAPKYKSIISGFVNGFAWGVIAVLMSGLGLIAQNIGITNLLVYISIIPVISALSIKYIKLN
jgi:FSR family fosmidomycin resistance protein-like MFS transporter